MSETQADYATRLAIQFSGQVFKVQTLVDGGLRLTLDLIEPTEPETIVKLIEARQPGIFLEIAAVAVKTNLTDFDNETEKSPKRSDSRVDRRRFAN